MVRSDAIFPGESQVGFMERTESRGRQGKAGSPGLDQGCHPRGADVGIPFADRVGIITFRTHLPPPSPEGAKRH